MPKYKPIDPGVAIKAVESDLFHFDWRHDGVMAYFVLADPGHLLRVTFERPCIVRLLDEMPLSTEDDETPKEGLVSNQLAYLVEGALFARTQSAAWRATCEAVYGPVSHYQFVTGWGCLDVLSSAAPKFSIVPRAGLDQFSPE